MSTKRQNQRYRILYVWKSLKDLVPSLGLSISNDTRRGPLIDIERISGKVMKIRTIKSRHIKYEGARLFNSLPRYIREFDGNHESFKYLLDKFLWTIPDCPILNGYSSHNLDKNNEQSNCISDWIRNLKLHDWVPDTTAIK